MKTFKSMEEFGAKWTKKEQELYDSKGRERWGKDWDDISIHINDCELDEKYGCCVKFTIPVKNK